MGVVNVTTQKIKVDHYARFEQKYCQLTLSYEKVFLLILILQIQSLAVENDNCVPSYFFTKFEKCRMKQQHSQPTSMNADTAAGQSVT